jgi:hypothetical protein
MGKLSNITKKINTIHSVRSQLLEDISNIDEELIRHLQGSHTQLKQNTAFCGFEEEYEEIARKIYEEKEGDNITGSGALDFLDNIKLLSDHYNKEKINMVEWYGQEMTKLIQQATLLKDKLLEVFRHDAASPSDKKGIPSNILKGNKKDREAIEYLLESLNHPKELQLLFRASEHDFKAQ